MFFRSAQALLLGVILIVVGAFQLLKGSYYIEVSKREGTTVGTILYVTHGRSPSYQYRYQANGVWIRDDSGSCRTALTPAGCRQGAQVLVYYDRDQVTQTLLEEFDAAGREKLYFGGFMAGCGLLLLVLYPIARRALKSPDESNEIDVDVPAVGPEIIHVVPEE
jgi:hypothetical protein